MRSLLLFVVGVCVGAMLTQSGAAQDSRPRGLNHVGIAVKNYDDTIAFYKSALGMQEAYALKTPDGGPLLTYLQVSRDTFPDPGLTPGMRVDRGDGVRTRVDAEEGDGRVEALELDLQASEAP